MDKASIIGTPSGNYTRGIEAGALGKIRSAFSADGEGAMFSGGRLPP